MSHSLVPWQMVSYSLGAAMPTRSQRRMRACVTMADLFVGNARAIDRRRERTAAPDDRRSATEARRRAPLTGRARAPQRAHRRKG